jgi:hypothetical protein
MPLPLPCPKGTWQRDPTFPDGEPVEFKHELACVRSLASPASLLARPRAHSATTKVQEAAVTCPSLEHA